MQSEETVSKLSIEHQKVLQTPEKFYEYLKTMYGVEGTEKDRAIGWSILKMMDILHPDFPKDMTPTPVWQIHLESTDDENCTIVTEEPTLVFGVHNIGSRGNWSRILQIEPSTHPGGDRWYAHCEYSIFPSNFFEKQDKEIIKAVAVFFTLMAEFIAQY